jgi:hypothetical protein
VAALLDEIAFFPTDDSANPDYDILDAIRPGMATIPNAMLLCASSPYARRGALWDAHRRHFGNDGDPVLVWRAPTRTMNPSVSQQVIDAATERDPASAAAEWLAEFQGDIESFINREAVEACIAWDVRERAPIQSVRYDAIVDPAAAARAAATGPQPIGKGGGVEDKGDHDRRRDDDHQDDVDRHFGLPMLAHGERSGLRPA